MGIGALLLQAKGREIGAAAGGIAAHRRRPQAGGQAQGLRGGLGSAGSQNGTRQQGKKYCKLRRLPHDAHLLYQLPPAA
jgi:hypothetical protein